MNSVERLQLSQVLHGRRDAMANSWYQAIAATCHVPLKAAKVRQHLVELTEQAITVLLAEPFEPDKAQEIGAALAHLHYIQPQALGRTQEVLAYQLFKDLPTDQILTLQPLLAALLGGVAAGFLQQARETILAEQEEIRGELATELQSAEKALREAYDQLEMRVEERTLALAGANEELQAEIAERKRAEEALVRNLEERLATEETLRQRNRELALLNRAGQTLSSTLDLDQVLVIVLEEVRQLLGVVACSAWLIDAETKELVCRQAIGPRSERVRGWRLSPGEGLAGWTARSGESLIVPDVLADERHFKGVDQQTELPLRSILTVPLQVRQDVIGVLQLVDAEVDRFGSADLALLEPLASSAASGIENARLYEQVEGYAVEMAQRVAERTRELTEAIEQLEELDRLKSKFVTDVSHELRTPVANIKLYLHLLQGSRPEKHSQYLAIINEQTDRLVNLIEDILDLSRLALGEVKMEFVAVDLNAVAEQVIAAHQSRADVAGLELIFEPSVALPPVRADLHQLTQVITNLVNNAVNYTPAGHVGVSICLDAERGQVSEAKHQGQVCLEVQDTGMGIEPGDLPHVFERFYRGQRVGSSNIPGTGLGLAIVKEIVDLHQGEIRVESQVDEGSTFRVWLPLEESKTQNVKRTDS